jgi:hypothetical protein
MKYALLLAVIATALLAQTPAPVELTTANYGGCDPTGASDSTACLMRALTDASAKGFRLQVPFGHYKLTPRFTTGLILSGPLNVVADTGTIFDFSASTSTSFSLKVGGADPTPAAALGADAAATSRTLTSSLASSLNPGDIILITTAPYASTHTSDCSAFFDCLLPQGYKGEMVEVEGTSGTTIALQAGLYDSYGAAQTTLVKMNLPSISMSHITFVGNTATASAGLFIEYARNLILDDVNFVGYQERSLYTSYIFHGLYTNSHIDGMLSVATGTNYGIMIASSQSFNVTNSYLMGGRAGVDIGGREPNRQIVIGPGNTIGNLASSAAMSVDFHGDSEMVSVMDNTILNGVDVGGKNTMVHHNRIYGPTASQICVDLDPDISGNFFQVTNNTLNGCPTGIRFVSYSPQPITVADVLIAQNDIHATGNAGILPQGHTGSSSSIGALRLIDNDVSGALFALRVNNGGGGAFGIGSIQIRGGTYSGRNAVLVFDQELSPKPDLTVSGAILELPAGGAPSPAGITSVAGTLNSLFLEGTKIVADDPAGKALALNVVAAADVKVAQSRVVNATYASGAVSVTAAVFTWNDTELIGSADPATWRISSPNQSFVPAVGFAGGYPPGAPRSTASPR